MQTFYKELSPYYKYIVDFHAETDAEIAALNKIFRKINAYKILDVACGVGRHSVPLAKLGYKVTGIDFSKHQILEAKKYAKKEKAKANFLIKDANNFGFKEKFDAAICMWTTIGEEPMVYWKVMKNIYQSLKKNGIFVIDNNNWSKVPISREDFIKHQYVSKNLKIKQFMRDRFTEHFRVRDIVLNINGKKYKDLCVTYIKKPEEWAKELKLAGFRKTRIIKNYKKKKTSVLIIGVK